MGGRRLLKQEANCQVTGEAETGWRNIKKNSIRSKNEISKRTAVLTICKQFELIQR